MLVSIHFSFSKLLHDVNIKNLHDVLALWVDSFGNHSSL